jgi:hypothetical protein
VCQGSVKSAFLKCAECASLLVIVLRGAFQTRNSCAVQGTLLFVIREASDSIAYNIFTVTIGHKRGWVTLPTIERRRKLR